MTSTPFKWYLAARAAPVRGPSKAVLYALATYADEAGWCFPSQQTLADAAGVSVRTVRTAIDALHKAGLIEFGQRRAGGVRTIRLTLDVEGHATGTSAEDEPAGPAGGADPSGRRCRPAGGATRQEVPGGRQEVPVDPAGGAGRSGRSCRQTIQERSKEQSRELSRTEGGRALVSDEALDRVMHCYRGLWLSAEIPDLPEDTWELRRDKWARPRVEEIGADDTILILEWLFLSDDDSATRLRDNGSHRKQTAFTTLAYRRERARRAGSDPAEQHEVHLEKARDWRHRQGSGDATVGGKRLQAHARRLRRLQEEERNSSNVITLPRREA